MRQGPKFNKAFHTEDNHKRITDFIRVEEWGFRLFSRIAKVLHGDAEGKTLIFIKVLRGSVTSGTIDREVVVMEMGGNTSFEHLEFLAHEVFLPILSKPQNQARWREVLTQEY